MKLTRISPGKVTPKKTHLSTVRRRIVAYVETLQERFLFGLMTRTGISPLDAESPSNKPHLVRVARRIAAYVAGLQERIHFLEAVVQNFPGGISVYDRELRMVLCNDRQKRLLDYPPDLFAKGFPTMEDLFRFNAERGEYGPGDIQEQVRRRMTMAREATPHLIERTRPNGTVLEIRGAPVEGGGFVTTYLDVTEQRRANALIAHLTHHDALTNLPNRALFGDRLQCAISLAKKSGLIAVHYLDVDKFKPVNDMLGHEAGDVLLVAIAVRLAQAVRETDTVARLGGDEFAIVQTGIRETNDVADLARRLLQELKRPFDVCGQKVEVSASIGIAFVPLDGVTVDELLRKADMALARSKSNGRNQFTFFDADQTTCEAVAC